MWKSAVQQFTPVYFTMIMATGIISLAAHALQVSWVANGLFYSNLVLYPLFLLLLVGRVLFFFADCKAELTAHDKGAAYLALVAATCLVGNQLVVLGNYQAAGRVLWIGAGIAWVLLLYTFLLSVTLGREKPPLETGLNGSWLLLVVSTESLAVLGATLAPRLPVPAEVSLFVVLALMLLGSLFYLMLSTLLFYRLTFVRVGEEEVGAPYWISVGGSAIVVLAGATLVPALQQTPALAPVAGFIRGYSVLFWVVSTWWIPFVVALRLWHHLRARPAFHYQPAYWSMVFPLGMYTAATARLAGALPLPSLRIIPAYFFYVALLAWALVLAAMLYHLLRTATKSQVSQPG